MKDNLKERAIFRKKEKLTQILSEKKKSSDQYLNRNNNVQFDN